MKQQKENMRQAEDIERSDFVMGLIKGVKHSMHKDAPAS